MVERYGKERVSKGESFNDSRRIKGYSSKNYFQGRREKKNNNINF
tara:strand:+ start:209 stop:343 length:135 start_codon:yes stop_codon:yes gene_type:complete